MSDTLRKIENLTVSKHHSPGKDDDIYKQIGNFDRLRISALTKAAEMSSLVTEVTIGPNSKLNLDTYSSEPLETNQDSRGSGNSVSNENLNEDKIGEELRYTLRMKELELKLQESSEAIFKNLIEQMISNRTETMRRFWKKQSEECERKTLELKARKLRMLNELRENDNLSVLEQARQDERNCKIINKQTLETMNKILEEQNKATARYAAITDSHTKVFICYNEISNLLQTDQHAKNVCDKYIVTLNTVIGNIHAILELCKTGSIADKEVKQAEVLALNIENIKRKILDDISEIKQQELIKKKAELEAKQKELEAQREREIKAKAEVENQQKNQQEQSKKTSPMFYSDKNYAYYQELKSFLIQYENQYKDLVENTNYKKFRFDCQKAVNTPVNAISSVSGMHIKDKYDKLSKLLRGERVQVLDIYVQVTQHPQGLAYVTALLAKKIVRQGDLLVSSNPEAAFPLASVTVALWSQFPEFGKLLEAYFHRECPYLVPMFLPQKEGQTDKEFYQSRGYTYNDEGVVEKQDKFLKRMSGIFRLRCAIWIAKTPRLLNTLNPHGLRYGWQWLASFINLKPEPDLSATLLHDFITVCGSEFLKNYGKQFVKIIKLISTAYLKILEKIDEGGPKTRLEVFLQNVLNTSHIPPPSGLLEPNTW